MKGNSGLKDLSNKLKHMKNSTKEIFILNIKEIKDIFENFMLYQKKDFLNFKYILQKIKLFNNQFLHEIDFYYENIENYFINFLLSKNYLSENLVNFKSNEEDVLFPKTDSFSKNQDHSIFLLKLKLRKQKFNFIEDKRKNEQKFLGLINELKELKKKNENATKINFKLNQNNLEKENLFIFINNLKNKLKTLNKQKDISTKNNKFFQEMVF